MANSKFRIQNISEKKRSTAKKNAQNSETIKSGLKSVNSKEKSPLYEKRFLNELLEELQEEPPEEQFLNKIDNTYNSITPSQGGVSRGAHTQASSTSSDGVSSTSYTEETYTEGGAGQGALEKPVVFMVKLSKHDHDLLRRIALSKERSMQWIAKKLLSYAINKEGENL